MNRHVLFLTSKVRLHCDGQLFHQLCHSHSSFS